MNSNTLKPAFIYGKSIPSLDGVQTKMNGNIEQSSVFMKEQID